MSNERPQMDVTQYDSGPDAERREPDAPGIDSRRSTKTDKGDAERLAHRCRSAAEVANFAFLAAGR